MTHVVTDACIRCKYTDCVDVCPVDCFKEGPRNLFKAFSGIALECNRDEWMLRVRRMGSRPCKQTERPIARFHSNPSGKCLFGWSAALRRLPIARAIDCTPRRAPHPEKILARPRKRLEQVPPVIDPDECIDCAVCIPECPANAIYADTDLPAEFESFLEFNKKLAPGLPTITKRKPPLPDAEQWRVVSHKLSGLNLSP
jgi:NAD-dependent dihydropyrimidine dehydrogenase PreA subunit